MNSCCVLIVSMHGMAEAQEIKQVLHYSEGWGFDSWLLQSASIRV